MATKLIGSTVSTARSCGRSRPPRLWTLPDYESLTVSLLDRFTANELMCANFRAINVDPASIILNVLAGIDDISGDEDADVWLKGIHAILILVYGYMRKITSARIYKWVLKKFFLFSLLMIALEKIITNLIKLLEVIILHEAALRSLAELLSCTKEEIT